MKPIFPFVCAALLGAAACTDDVAPVSAPTTTVDAATLAWHRTRVAGDVSR